jgi:hypothetical protein
VTSNQYLDIVWKTAMDKHLQKKLEKEKNDFFGKRVVEMGTTIDQTIERVVERHLKTNFQASL